MKISKFLLLRKWSALKTPDSSRWSRQPFSNCTNPWLPIKKKSKQNHVVVYGSVFIFFIFFKLSCLFFFWMRYRERTFST